MQPAMVIMDADRFGLANFTSYEAGLVGKQAILCAAILVANPKTDSGKQHMKIMTETTNGFVLADS